MQKNNKSETSDNILNEIYKVILERKENRPQGSYVSSLFGKGQDAILKKVSEEAGEVIIASKNSNNTEIIYESSDLLFHILVVLGYHEIEPDEIFKELKRRFK